MQITDKNALAYGNNMLLSSEFKRYCFQFPHAYVSASAATGVEVGVPCADGRQIGKFAQLFWEALPDSSLIHNGHAFKQLCDMAEWYCFGGGDGDEFDGA